MGVNDGAAVRQNAQCDATRTGLFTATRAFSSECLEFTPNSSLENTRAVVDSRMGNPCSRALTENSMSAT